MSHILTGTQRHIKVGMKGLLQSFSPRGKAEQVCIKEKTSARYEPKNPHILALPPEGSTTPACACCPATWHDASHVTALFVSATISMAAPEVGWQDLRGNVGEVVVVECIAAMLPCGYHRVAWRECRGCPHVMTCHSCPSTCRNWRGFLWDPYYHMPHHMHAYAQTNAHRHK